MAAQLAPTPVVKGTEALKILAEANRKTSAKAEEGAKKLASIFDKMVKPEKIITYSNKRKNL